MRFRNTADLSYLACAVDERALFYTLKTGNIQIVLRVKNRLLVRDLKREFGGSCPEEIQRGGRYWYRVQGKSAVALLQAVLPYLRRAKKSVTQILDAWNRHKQRV